MHDDPHGVGTLRHLTVALLVLGGLSLGFTLKGAEPAAGATGPKPASIPVLYGTDLFHPHDDPDDHFDLATLYAIPEFDLKGIVLDQGAKQLQKPGSIPVGQLNRLSRRNVPTALGLADPLTSPTDRALHQKPEFQAGVKLILDTLRHTTRPVMIITVGSTRDVVAAFNREPELFRRRVGKLLCFIGEASKADFREYNVGLDPQAYVGLMRSGLAIYWVPCFDGGLWQNQGHASFWQAKHSDLLRWAPPALIRYFIYALEQEKADPAAVLAEPVDPERQARLFAGTRNLWCTAVFTTLAGYHLVADENSGARLVRPGERLLARAAGAGLFTFTPVELTVSDDAVIRYGPGPGSRKVMRFEIRNRARYAEGMTAATADLLAKFPISVP